MHIVDISSNEEQLVIYHERFYKKFEESNHTVLQKIPISLMKKSSVFAVYDDKKEMIAGYTVRKDEPIWLIQHFSEEEKEELYSSHREVLEDSCELILLWKHHSVPKKKMLSIVWPHIMNTILCTKKNYLLGYTQSDKLNKMYKIFSPTTLYLKNINEKYIHFFYYPRKKIKLVPIYLSVNKAFQKIFSRSDK